MDNRPPEIDGITVPYGLPPMELQSLVTNGSAQRWVAIAALANSSQPGAMESLASAAKVADPHVRRFAVQWIGRSAHGPKLGQVVVDALSDPSEFVVRTAANVAAELSLASAHGALLELLKAPSPSTRESALWALEKLWQETDFEAVLALFTRDTSLKVRRTAAWVLRAMCSPARASMLIELWRSDSLARHRLWACKIVEEFPKSEYRQTLVQLGKDVDGHVRKAASRALDAIGRAV